MNNMTTFFNTFYVAMSCCLAYEPVNVAAEVGLAFKSIHFQLLKLHYN